MSELNQIVQSPKMIAIRYESDGTHRPMAAGLPKKLSNPLGWGARLARWEGDARVVDTAGFNNKTWLGLMGHPHSGALRITER